MSDPSHDPVAIVGIGCRFPGGVVDPASFWALLREGRDAVGEVPADRIDLDRFYDARPATRGRMMSRRGGFLDRIDAFDADFFGISPREAQVIDPQQRVLLETAWEALEDAGQDVLHLEGSDTAVYIGQWVSDFESRLFSHPDDIDFLSTLGSGRYATSGRISYVFGFRGPSLTIDSACSSSLAAVHLGVRSLRSGEARIALAGGVNMILQPHITIGYSQSRMMAADGHCKFGDASGDGYVRSEGAGVVALKRLSDALADGDRIYAVIRGSSVNNDGRSSGVMGRPSRVGHEEMLRTAYRDADVPASQVAYVEAHGTGTRAGDPVEIAALGAVLGEARALDQTCRIGSVKTNIGHTEGAAGVAGLIKAALSLHHEAVPASLHFVEPNPGVPWSELPFRVPTALSPWPASDVPRFAGVNSFGIAGTNAHVVLQEAPRATAKAARADARPGVLLPLSARSPEALRALALRHAELLASEDAPALQDLCHSAALHRAALEVRASFAAGDAAGLRESLKRFAAGEGETVLTRPGERPRIAFVVPGQGAQWSGMARQLIDAEPVFREALSRCDAAARPHLDVSILAQLQAEPNTAEDQLERIDVVQPVLVSLAIAYAALLRSWGVQPDAVVGHSMGEVGAACIAGVLDIEQAMQVVCARSRLMRRVSGAGAMALVDLSMEDTRLRLRGREAQLSLAVSNSPRSSVISGDPEAIEAVMAELEREQVFCRLVKVDVASHSPQMEPLAKELAQQLDGLTPTTAQCSLYSTVWARRVDGPEMSGGYWAENLRQPVLFSHAIEKMLEDGLTVFVELGPHPVLLPSLQQTAQIARREVASVACGHRDEPDVLAALSALGTIWTRGGRVDWLASQRAQGSWVNLPVYPWQRERHWAAAADVGAVGGQGQERFWANTHPVLGQGIELAGVTTGGLWALSIDPARIPAWFEHGLHGSTVFPASAYLELALAVARTLAPDASTVVRDLAFERAWYLQTDVAGTLQLQARANEQSGWRLDFQSHTDTGWVRHVGATLSMGAPASVVPSKDVGQDRQRRSPGLSGDEVYARLQSMGAHFGPNLRRIAEAWLAPGEAAARISVDAQADALTERFCVAPAVLDACFQLMVLLAPDAGLCLPSTLASALWHRAPRGELWVEARLRPGMASVEGVVVDAVLRDDQGPVLDLHGVVLRPLGAAAAPDTRGLLFDTHWVPATAPMVTVPPVSRQWLLIGSGQGMGEALVEQAQREGVPLTRVTDPLRLPEVLSVAHQAAPTGCRTEVIDLRALDLLAVDAGHAVALHALLQPAQALARLPASFDVRLWWVTRGAQVTQAADAATLELAQAPVAGLAAVLAVEQGDRWGGTIDLDPAVATTDMAAALMQAITAEAGSLALRQGKRLQARVRQCPAEPSLDMPRWRKDSAYLLTGGLGGVGAQVARWWVNEGVRHLVVLSRTPLPERSQWAAIDSTTPAGRAVATVRELETLGAHVQHVAVDVADEAALSDWLSRFQAEGRPAIRGVFHLAAITDDKLVHDLDAASLGAVLRPKLLGASNLHRLLPELDCFVLFSSMAALMPQAGQASYAAANAFLDALAQRRRSGGQHALSIGWGVWTQTGVMQGEVGRRQLDDLTRQGIGGFTPQQALVLLAEVLPLPVAHVLVMPVDWSRLRAALGGRRMPLLQDLLDRALADTAQGGSQSAVPDVPDVPMDPAERRRALERSVRDVVGRVLKLTPAKIDPRKPLGSMGLTSIMALELRNRLEPLHGKPLSATLAWNYPTVDALVGFLFGEHETAASPAPAAATAQTPHEALGDVNELSDEDAAKLLRKRR